MNMYTDSKTRAMAMRGAIAIAALGLFASGAAAQSADAPEKPASTIEIGGGDVTDGSYKAGEYNGLQKKGGFVIGDIDLRGGGTYDSDSAGRIRVVGTDLGLDSRSLFANGGVQGRFRFTAGFDQLRRNRSDTYQTPYNGAGTNNLTLPSSWLVPTVAGSTGTNNAVNNLSARGLVKTIGNAAYIDTMTTSPTFGLLLSPTAAQRSQVDAAANTDVPAFHNFDVFTKRTRFNVGISANLTPQWVVDASVTPEHKEGTKLMGTVSRNTGGDIAAIVPDVIDQDTNQVAFNLSFNGKKSYVQGAYYGSFFKNNIKSMSWQNWATAGLTTNTMGSAPSNDFNQMSLNAGFNLTANTKLTANAAYGRNTQNDAFLTDASTPVVPVTSLNGVVVNSAVGLRLTARPRKSVSFLASYKFDNRDNQTPVHIYQYSDAGEAPSASSNFPAGNPLGAVRAQNANANRPYSRKLNQAEAEADLKIASGQWIKGAYQFERIDRSCAGTWIDCADAAVTNENTLKAEWRANAGADVNMRVAYDYGRRRTPSYNENAFLALVPYAGVVPAGQTISALQAMLQNGLTGYGPVLGYNNGVSVNSTFFPSNNPVPNALYANNNRISELIGMRRYYVADRNRNRVRGTLNWQATDAFALQATADYTADHYPTSIYGLQDQHTWSATLDATYAVNTTVSADLFYTYENLQYVTAGNTYTANSNTATIAGAQASATGLSGNSCDGYTTLQQRNNNNKLDPCLNWSSDMRDRSNTVGAGLRQSAGKLELDGHLIVSRSESDNAVKGGNWANNLLLGPANPATTIAAYYIPAAPLPTVTTTTTELRVNGKYSIAKKQAIRILYTYMRMTSADWAYEGMQFGTGTLSGVLPTLEQPFNYSVNLVGVSWVIGF